MSTGWKRLWISINLVLAIPVIIGSFIVLLGGHDKEGPSACLFACLVLSAVYWMIIGFSAWVIRGFRQKPHS